TLARGRAGWAIAASAQPDFFADRQAAFDMMLGLLQGPAYDFFPAVDHWVDQFKRGRRDEVFADLDAWLGLWRDLLLMRSGCADLILNVDYADQLQAQAARYTLDRLRDAIAATRDGVRWLDENVAPRTALEAMVLRWQEDR
ncbi:MAG: hypothetical protein ACTHMP_09240, partial [Thermomicrobiales bacterium]